ncbi:hypothetical protein L3Q82_017842 [Scortum barcoo]|uniref:Uncharacterized protein n=1 Tax=Scortum barcoo TaxID=214431 RepID=A0ACB8VHM8_9TELE|nr:hypothetical protein L3Q82_017842 [Scortum barcoo]
MGPRRRRGARVASLAGVFGGQVSVSDASVEGGLAWRGSGSQMPRHLISDAHEWMNEIPTVPTYYLAKPQPRERAWQNQRGKKTLLSLTLVWHCEET